MNYNDYADNMLKGTTTVGIICTDGVVIGSDSRATAGTFIASTEAIKIYKVDENLGITIAGGVGDAEYIVKVLKAQNELYKMSEGRPMSPAAAASLLSLILQENKWNPYIVELIVGGLNRGAPEVYGLDPFGGSIKDSKFTATGSGSIAAIGYLEGVYAPTISTNDGVKHCARALDIAMRRDSATGNAMRIVAITKKGYREYTREEAEKMLK